MAIVEYKMNGNKEVSKPRSLRGNEKIVFQKGYRVLAGGAHIPQKREASMVLDDTLEVGFIIGALEGSYRLTREEINEHASALKTRPNSRGVYRQLKYIPS